MITDREGRRERHAAILFAAGARSMHTADGWQMIAAGASLIQLYTGLVYRGPDLIAEAAAAISAQN